MDKAIVVSTLLSLYIFAISDGAVLEFLSLGTTPGVTMMSLENLDDFPSEAINISVGFPFAGNVSFGAYVSDNGFISFGQRWDASGVIPNLFPDSVDDRYIVAPYWYDHDLRIEGDVLYEVHELGITESEQLLEQVSSFISSETGFTFDGVWMLVVFWDEVHPFPHGEMNPSPDCEDFVDSVNSYQAIMITDGLIESYALFTYKCGLVEWSGIEPIHAIVGYSASGEYYMNYPGSGTANITSLACVNHPGSDWSNVVYNLTVISEQAGLSTSYLLTGPLPSSAPSTSLPQVIQTVTTTAHNMISTSTSLQTSPTVTPVGERNGNGTVNKSGVPPEVIIPPVVVVVILCAACAVTYFVAFFVSKKREKRKVQAQPQCDIIHTIQVQQFNNKTSAST